MKTEIIKITPDQARQWIENANFSNPREKINWRNVTKFARAIKDGKWTTTHQGIAFDKFNRLVDGQHRLLAIIESGIPIYLMVTTGVSLDSVPDMDQGSKRDTATLLNVDERYAGVVGFLTRLVISQRPTRYDLETMRSLVLDDTERLIATCGTSKAKISTAPVRAAFVFFEQKYNIKNLFNQYRDFVLLDLRKLETIQCVSTGLRALHQRLTGSNGKTVRSIYEINPNEVFAYTIYVLKNEDKGSLKNVNVESLLNECRDFYREFIPSLNS
jgi:hypothetical protein